MSNYTYESASYNNLDALVDDFDKKYEYKKLLEEKRESFNNIPNYNYYNHTIVTYSDSLIHILKNALYKISNLIKLSLVKHNSHYKRLMKVNREIRCGFNMHKFRSKAKYNSISLTNVFDNVKINIFQFLAEEDSVSFNIARVSCPERTREILSKMPAKIIPNSTYFNYFQHCHMSDGERILKLASPRKSWNKKRITDALVENEKKIFYNFNRLPIEYMADMKSDEEENAYINTHLFKTDRSMINTNYAKKHFKFHKAIELWQIVKLSKKKMKTTKNPKNKLNQ
jgi:hypothetical protein